MLERGRMCKHGHTGPSEHARITLSHKVIHKAIVAYMSNIEVDHELK